MYEQLYTLLRDGIYGSVALTSDMTLTLTFMSTLGCLLLVCLPFYLVYRIVRFL